MIALDKDRQVDAVLRHTRTLRLEAQLLRASLELPADPEQESTEPLRVSSRVGHGPAVCGSLLPLCQSFPPA